MGTDLSIILRAEVEAARILQEASERQKQLISDATHLGELRLAALEPPLERPVRPSARPPNLAFLRALAAKNKERAIARILEAFDATA